MIMTMKILRPLAAFLLGLSLMAGTAFAQDEASIMEQLGLTPAQKETIKDLREQFIRDTEKVRADIRRLLEEERKLKSASKPSEAVLRKKLMERADKEIEFSLALTRFNERVEDVLTAQQLRKLETLRKEQSAREQRNR